jgi:hypothetical protein
VAALVLDVPEFKGRFAAIVLWILEACAQAAACVFLYQPHGFSLRIVQMLDDSPVQNDPRAEACGAWFAMKRCKYWIIAACLIAFAVVATQVYTAKTNPASHALPITQDAYLWQHDWSPSVHDAIVDQHAQFHRLVILVAEISPRASPPTVVWIHPDYSALAQSVHEIGIAIRIGPASGSAVYESDSPQSQLLCDTVRRAVTDARSSGLAVAEVQIDFDCAESKLAGYRTWVLLAKSAIVPTPVVITALPSWLKRSEFPALAIEAGGFVMQVHSLHRPIAPDSNLTICEAGEASQAVIDASKIGVPFRVALPTYSYLAAFSAEGKFLGLSAEGPLGSWPAGSILKPMQSDPVAIAPLVANWTAHPPGNLTGIIWYRLPVAGDSMNWAPVTLRAVMAGHAPKPNLVTDLDHGKPGLVDVFVKNTGDADSNIRIEVAAESDHGFIISEAINGFDRLEEPSGNVIFRDRETDGRRIAPGERIQVGWMRLATDNIATDREVQAHVTSAHP